MWHTYIFRHYSRNRLQLWAVCRYGLYPVWNPTCPGRSRDEFIGGYNWSNQFNTLRPRQNGRHFPDNIAKCILLNENVWISLKISLKFVPQGPINNIPALVQIMAWRRPGDKLLSGPMAVKLPTHICVTRPQWVKPFCDIHGYFVIEYQIIFNPILRQKDWMYHYTIDLCILKIKWWQPIFSTQMYEAPLFTIGVIFTSVSLAHWGIKVLHGFANALSVHCLLRTLGTRFSENLFKILNCPCQMHLKMLSANDNHHTLIVLWQSKDQHRISRIKLGLFFIQQILQELYHETDIYHQAISFFLQLEHDLVQINPDEFDLFFKQLQPSLKNAQKATKRFQEFTKEVVSDCYWYIFDQKPDVMKHLCLSTKMEEKNHYDKIFVTRSTGSCQSSV